MSLEKVLLGLADGFGLSPFAELVGYGRDGQFLEPHAPIRVSSNEDVHLQVGVELWMVGSVVAATGLSAAKGGSKGLAARRPAPPAPSTRTFEEAVWNRITPPWLREG